MICNEKMESVKLDISNSEFRLGLCPVCNSDWDGGEYIDWYKKLREHGLMDGSDEELEVEAKRFSEISTKRISNLRGGGRPGRFFFHQCPFCRTSWDASTGDQINNNDYNIY